MQNHKHTPTCINTDIHMHTVTLLMCCYHVAASRGCFYHTLYQYRYWLEPLPLLETHTQTCTYIQNECSVCGHTHLHTCFRWPPADCTFWQYIVQGKQDVVVLNGSEWLFVSLLPLKSLFCCEFGMRIEEVSCSLSYLDCFFSRRWNDLFLCVFRWKSCEDVWLRLGFVFYGGLSNNSSPKHEQISRFLLCVV